ncbi:MAG: hypothetical protein IPG10_07580 [Flavobacteriales bacterium]|nr:hypothetical protein [Flavobacteriales bacterium]
MLPLRSFLLTAASLTILGVMAQTPPRIWNIKTVLPTGVTLDVKAFDKAGKQYDVKALENGDTHVMDVKAIDGATMMPIKVLVSTDAFLPVKAIAADGTLLDVKALDANGERLDVKGVAQAGHLYHIKAIGPDRALYGVKAISPTGQMRDIKGVQVDPEEVAAVVQGVKVAAHVKALPHATDSDGDPIWNVKCVQPDGHVLGIKAVDKTGALHDVKAFLSNGDATVLDIKALIQGEQLPVKVLVSGDALSPVKAIGKDGTIYAIKAITADGAKLDVKGASRSGNVYNIKAISANGEQMAVKAISPHGLFYDVKGVKFTADDKEMDLNGAAVRAHVKALPQVE